MLGKQEGPVRSAHKQPEKTAKTQNGNTRNTRNTKKTERPNNKKNDKTEKKDNFDYEKQLEDSRREGKIRISNIQMIGYRVTRFV